MTTLRVPCGQMVAIGADLQRAANELAEYEGRLLRALARLQPDDPKPQQRRDRKLEEAEEQVLAAHSQVRHLAERATAMAACLREVVGSIDAVDRRAAARIPSVPRLVGALPVLRPDARPWPYAAVPPITTVSAVSVGQLVRQVLSATSTASSGHATPASDGPAAADGAL